MQHNTTIGSMRLRHGGIGTNAEAQPSVLGDAGVDVVVDRLPQIAPQKHCVPSFKEPVSQRPELKTGLRPCATGIQWRWVRTKIKNLLDLGVSLKTAIQHGVSSKR